MKKRDLQAINAELAAMDWDPPLAQRKAGSPSKPSNVAALAAHFERLQTPDKLRLAAGVLEQANDLKTAIVMVKRALDELTLVDLLGRSTQRDNER